MQLGYCIVFHLQRFLLQATSNLRLDWRFNGRKALSCQIFRYNAGYLHVISDLNVEWYGYALCNVFKDVTKAIGSLQERYDKLHKKVPWKATQKRTIKERLNQRRIKLETEIHISKSNKQFLAKLEQWRMGWIGRRFSCLMVFNLILLATDVSLNIIGCSPLPCSKSSGSISNPTASKPNKEKLSAKKRKYKGKEKAQDDDNEPETLKCM
jgi:hypothetical protein